MTLLERPLAALEAAPTAASAAGAPEGPAAVAAPDVDRHGLRTSVLLGLVVAAAMSAMVVWYLPVLYGVPQWWVGGDIWGAVDCARRISDGAVAYMYQTPYPVYAMPLGFVLLAPAVAIGDHLGLVDGAPFPLAHPSMWLAVGPYSFLWCIALLDAVRRVAFDLGVRRRALLGLQVAAAAVVMVPAATWDHPEDVLALAAGLHCLRWCWRGRFGWAAVALGVAVASKQWALVLAPFALVSVPPGRRLRWSLTAAALPAGLTGICLLADWPDASWHLFAPVTDPLSLLSGHHALFGRALGAATSRYGRGLELCGSLPAAWWARRRSRSAQLAALAVVLLARPVLEPIDWAYYWAPGLCVGMLALVALDRGRLRWSTWAVPVVAMVWTLHSDHDTLLWWSGLGVVAVGFALLRRVAAQNAKH